jgi:glucose/arabinose dehydrogenase
VGLDLILADETIGFPVHMTLMPDGSDRMVVVQKTGFVKWFSLSERRIGGTVINIQGRVFYEGWEDGLLSIAFDPEFSKNRYFYLFYSAVKPLRSVISRFTLDPDGLTADPASELILLEVEKPSVGHNGGQLLFGPDGYLYASIGDGQGTDPGYVQTRKTLLGTIIRIDVREASADRLYRIPPDNPFATAQDGTRPEIWAYGFRNPWRFSLDPSTGILIAADVGDRAVEEIDRVVRGGNYGWPVMEGDRCYAGRKDIPVECDRDGLTLPIAAFRRSIFRTIIGGFVYHGSSVPWLKGRYVFGDYFRGVYAIPHDSSEIIHWPALLNYRPRTQIVQKGESIHLSSFAEDARGELYVLSLRGEIYKLVQTDFMGSLSDFLRHLLFR